MADDLTTDEREAMDDTGMDGEEAHRYGELEDLRDRLDRVLDTLDRFGERIDALYDKVTMAPAVDAMNGEVAGDLDGDGDIDVVDLTPDFDGADLTIDELADWE